MALNSLKQQGFFYGALLYVFLIPFPQKIINLSLMAWVLLSLVSYQKTTLAKNKWLWLLPAFYVTYFIGFFSSEFFSFKFLEYKLSLLIFPILFFLHSYNQRQRNIILKTFVWGLLLAGAVCLAWALYNSLGTQNGSWYFQSHVLEGKGFMESILYGGNYFFGLHFSIFHQTVYFALYLTVGIAILLFRPKLFTLKKRLFFLIFLLALVFLVSNKASFIALMGVFTLKLWIWNTKPTRKKIAITTFVVFFVSFAFLNPRVRESITGITNGKIRLNKEARYGFETRLLSWDAALSLIKEKPIFGHGHSEAKNALNRVYKEKGYTFPLKESYNAHNLWLQSWLENGVLAVILLLSLFCVGFYKSSKTPLLIAFIIVLLVNSMFEGLFNRFSGISFFSFLICFIFSSIKGEEVSKS